MKNIPSTFLCFLILCTSCDLFTNEQKETTGELMPLAVGNYWEYENTYLDVIKDTLLYEVTEEIQIPIGDTTYTAYAMNFIPLPPDLPSYYWLRRNDEEGLFLMGGISDTDTLFMNEVEYRLPIRVGEIFETPRISFSFARREFYISDTLSITLIDDDREVITPAGKFKCFVYNFDLSAGDDVAERFDYYLFYSLGVGLVKQEERGKFNQDIKSEFILMNYQIR